MNKKIISIFILSVLFFSIFLTSCSRNKEPKTGETQETEAVSDAVLVTSHMIVYDEDDNYSDFINQNPSYIGLGVTSTSINGAGAEVKGSTVTISAEGVYVISGKLHDGQIIVDSDDKGAVRLVLNGAEINCSNNAPIYVKSAGKTLISLPEGTNNTVTDGKEYADSGEDGPTAAIFSKDDLTINGTGTLNVNGNYKDGITGKDDLKITGGIININAADDALVGRDMVLVKDGTFTIKAGGDGIKSTNESNDIQGFIALQGGSYNITSGTDGIQAKVSMLITDGKYTISTGGGSINSSSKSDNIGSGQWGDWGKGKPNDSSSESGEEEETPSAKGIKASSDITIWGGTFNIDSSDDAINSKNSVNIKGGDISIASGDDGIHADSSLAISDGNIDITKSYEGVESTLITFTGGRTHIVSSDDGVNVSGGSDGSSVNGRPGQNGFAASPNSKLNINGGYISVNAGGDGLDSNGSMYFTDGTALVSGPTSSGNGAIDYNGTFQMTGGFLIAAGSAGMAQAPSEESAQYSINMLYTSTQQGGTLVNLQDSNGNTITTFSPEKDYQSVVISSSELKKGGAYTLYSGGTSTGTLTDGLYTDGEYKDGTKVVEFTISKIVTWMSETGETTAKSASPGGPGGQGHAGKPGDFNKPPRPQN